VEVDKEKAARLGISTARVMQTVGSFLGGFDLGAVHDEEERHPVKIHVRLPREYRAHLSDLGQIYISDREGRPISLASLAEWTRGGLCVGGADARFAGLSAAGSGRPSGRDGSGQRRQAHHGGAEVRLGAAGRHIWLPVAVGRRDAPHPGRVPGSGVGVHGGAGADLPAAGGLLCQLRHPAAGDGGHPAHHDRHLPGTLDRSPSRASWCATRCC